jgi:hypothetical protein
MLGRPKNDLCLEDKPMDINLSLLGMIYVAWLLLFWITYALFARKLGLSCAYHSLAVVAGFIPPLALVYLMLLAWFGLKADHRAFTPP